MSRQPQPSAAAESGSDDLVPDLTYAAYLHLPQLLDTQHPSTPESDRVTHAAEHFFIVTHQSCELWLKQAVLDLELASEALRQPPRDLGLCLEQVRRVARIVGLVEGHFRMMERLSVRCFARFRPRLGTASGSQSGQFAEVFRQVGLYGAKSPLYEGFLAALGEHDLTVTDVYRGAPHTGLPYVLAEALIDLSEKIRDCLLAHVDVVARQIGGKPGTGGSSGVAHLAGRVAAPFPELWEARATAAG